MLISSIEDDVSYYQQYSRVFLIGDLNSRTSVKPDYIENNRPIVNHGIEIEVDTPIQWYSLDRGCYVLNGVVMF